MRSRKRKDDVARWLKWGSPASTGETVPLGLRVMAYQCVGVCLADIDNISPINDHEWSEKR
jgi:hypothetical protein